MLCFWSKWTILWNWLEQLVKRSNGNHWKAGKYFTIGINLSVTIHFVHRTWTVPKFSLDLILCFLFFKLIFWMGSLSFSAGFSLNAGLVSIFAVDVMIKLCLDWWNVFVHQNSICPILLNVSQIDKRHQLSFFKSLWPKIFQNRIYC